MKCSQLKFGWLNTITNEVTTHDFTLGLGPCGRWVTELVVEIDLATVRVQQTSYDIDWVAENSRLASEYCALVAEQRIALGDGFEKGHGWDNLLYMTPTEASWTQAYKEHCRQRQEYEGHKPEVKHFMYRLEDIRGRITAL